LEVATILVKWEIGRSIKSFYQGKYGARELEKIAMATGIGRDNLNKMIKFAEQYTLEQLKTLIEGKFALSWNGIAHNLSIKAETLIEIYEKAGNVSEFHYGIMNLKDPDEKRGKVKPPKIVEAPALDVEMPDILKVASTEIKVTMIPEKVAEKPVIVAPKIITDESIQTADLEYFKLQNEGLWKELSNTKQKFSELYRTIDEHLRTIEKRDILIRKYRERFNRLRYMIEDGYSADEIIELLAAVE